MFFGRYPYNLEKDKLIPIEKNMYFYSSSLSGMCKTAIKGLLEPVYLERVLLTNDSPLYSWLAYNMTIIQEPDGKLTTERKTHLYYLNEPTIKNKLSNSNNSSSHLTKTNSNFKLTVTNLGSDNSKGATNKDLRPSLPNINNSNNATKSNFSIVNSDKPVASSSSSSNLFNHSKKYSSEFSSRSLKNMNPFYNSLESTVKKSSFANNIVNSIERPKKVFSNTKDQLNQLNQTNKSNFANNVVAFNSEDEKDNNNSIVIEHENNDYNENNENKMENKMDNSFFNNTFLSESVDNKNQIENSINYTPVKKSKFYEDKDKQNNQSPYSEKVFQNNTNNGNGNIIVINIIY